jgi:PhzF family phenazine biosynthesis protein
MRRPIYVVDSFSGTAFGGNPAGVLLDGADLSEAQLAKIAAEMRHSETAFVLPSRDPAATFHLRWLTPKAEVQFCGHATLAAIAVMVEEAKRLRVPERGIVKTAFTSRAGLLRVELSRDEQKKLRIRFETPASSFQQTPVSERLLSSLGLIAEVLDPTFAPRQAATTPGSEGNLYICLREREHLARAKCDPAALHDALAEAKSWGVVLFSRSPAPGVDAAVRCFFPDQLDGSGEDPVTGSAAGQLACLLQDVLPEDLPRSLAFTQGTELGRPGRVEIDVRPEATPGQIRAWIGGEFTVVLRGELDLR